MMDEKLKEIFDNEYSESLLTDFYIKTQKVYEFFGYEFKLKPMENSNSVYERTNVSNVWLDGSYVNSLISNLEVIEFNLVYPQLITKIADTNLEKFNEVYCKLLEIYYYVDKDINLRKYINMTYGCLGNPKSLIFSDNIYLVSKILNDILLFITYEFKGHIVYFDNGLIFFRNFDEIRERFEKYFSSINKYELTYTYKKSKFGLFVSKKHYICEENGSIKIRGIKHFHKDGMSRCSFININD